MRSPFGQQLGGPPSPFGNNRWTPRRLFSSGQQGWWFDNSDMSTMFQDSAGTTPVTAVEQTVGLQLDKSKGLALGAELVTDGDFGLGTTANWGINGAGASRSAATNQLVLTNGGAACGSTQTITTVSGKWYKLTGQLLSITGVAFPRIRCGSSGAQSTQYANTILTAPSNFTQYFLAAGTSTTITLAELSTGVGNTSTWDNISVREIAGNHRFQSDSSKRPVLKVDSNGCFYLLPDGTNDFMETAAIDFSGGDSLAVFAGVRKLSDAAQAVVCELTASVAANNGGFLLAAPDGATATFAFDSKGTVQVDAIASSQTAPLSAVLAGIADISADSCVIRVNGVQADSDTGDQGTGNYSNAAAYFFSRAGTSLFFSGREYQDICVSPAPDAATIAQTEAWTNSVAKVY